MKNRVFIPSFRTMIVGVCPPNDIFGSFSTALQLDLGCDGANRDNELERLARNRRPAKESVELLSFGAPNSSDLPWPSG